MTAASAPGGDPRPLPDLLVARGLSHTYRTGRVGLHGVDLTVAPGEIVAVIGPNGSGKSTLCRLATGDLTPTGGSIEVLEIAPRRHGATERRRIGRAADAAVHFDALTAAENARFFGRAAGLDAAGARDGAERLLARFGLASERDVPVAEYSLGMRRRLLLVEALLHAPSLLLLDEPTLGLDPAATRTLEELLAEVAARGGAALVATNDVRSAERCATRVVFLKDGAKVADASPAALLRSVRGFTLIHVRLEVPPEALPRLPEGTEASLAGEELIVRSTTGPSVLPELCDVLLREGAAIRGISVHEADLGDVFHELTGVSIDASPPAPPPTEARRWD